MVSQNVYTDLRWNDFIRTKASYIFFCETVVISKTLTEYQFIFSETEVILLPVQHTVFVNAVLLMDEWEL